MTSIILSQRANDSTGERGVEVGKSSEAFKSND
jgi:hypothetical protein